MNLDLFEYTISAHFASAIINDDYSGLGDSEAKRLDSWLDHVIELANKQGKFNHFDTAGDGYQFAQCEITGLGSNVLDLLVVFEPST